MRHGQASFGADNYDVLSEQGFRQAELLGEQWLGMEVGLDAIYSGELQRQVDTAATVLKMLAEQERAPPEIIVDPAFNEYDFQPIMDLQLKDLVANGESFGWAELKRDKKLFHKFLEGTLASWLSGKLAGPEIESWPDFQTRCVAGLKRVMQAHRGGKTVAIFSSAGSIGAGIQHVLGLGDAQTIRVKLSMYNTGITQLLYNDDEVNLMSLNTLAHLERPEHKQLITFR